MLGQFPDWFVLADGVVVDFVIGVLLDGVVAVVVVELPLAALAMAVPPPATAPARDRVTRATFSCFRT
jgi:hypothetical protein